MEEIRLVIVDDSRIFRCFTEEAVKKIPNVKIVASVWSGEKALEYIRSNEVDLVSMDIEMPGMCGLETLRAIQQMNQQNNTKIGVIMLSSLVHNGASVTMKALELGAFDFIAKPTPEESNAAEVLQKELSLKITAWQKARSNSNFTVIPSLKSVKLPITPAPEPVSLTKRGEPKKTGSSESGLFDLICVGVSTGGPNSLQKILPDICMKTQCPILIVQHMPPGFTESLAKGLNRKCSNYTVIEAKNCDTISGQQVFIAPGGFHMVVRNTETSLQIGIHSQPPENGCRPSVDVLFRSVAQVSHKRRVLSIILTGMGSDGSAGLAPLKRAGAVILAQDEASSVVWGMPGSAVATGHVDKIVSLDALPAVIAVLQK